MPSYPLYSLLAAIAAMFGGVFHSLQYDTWYVAGFIAMAAVGIAGFFVLDAYYVHMGDLQSSALIVAVAAVTLGSYAAGLMLSAFAVSVLILFALNTIGVMRGFRSPSS